MGKSKVKTPLTLPSGTITWTGQRSLVIGITGITGIMETQAFAMAKLMDAGVR